MNIYLDIDGVLVDKKGKPAPGLVKFMKHITDKHDVYWLTTWVKDGNPERALRILGDYVPLKILNKIKPTTWNTWKTEAIDFSKDFRWFDDCVFPEEERILAKNEADHKLILINQNLELYIKNLDVYLGTEEEVLDWMKNETKPPVKPKLETKIVMGHVMTGKYAYLQHFLHKYSKDCKFLLVDGDRLHFNIYRGFSFLLSPVVQYDWDRFSNILRWVDKEIDNRKEENKKEPKIVLLVGQYAGAMSLFRVLLSDI